MITDYIPYGHNNAVKISTLKAYTGYSNRVVRRAIETARQDELIINLQDGKGYFKPTEEEADLVGRYMRQEEARMKSIADNVGLARKFLLTLGDE